MKKLFLTSVLALATLLASAQTATTWKNDPAHSRLGFEVKHLTISYISGAFDDFSVTVETSAPDRLDAKIVVKAKVKSINTGIEMRDNHLRSADFFDVDKYPEMTFVSTSLKQTGKNKGKLYGNLTFHGIIKPIELDVVFFGEVTNPMSNQLTAGFQITGIVKRSDYNLGGSFPEAVIANDIKIIANAEFSPAQ